MVGSNKEALDTFTENKKNSLILKEYILDYFGRIKVELDALQRHYMLPFPGCIK